MCLKTVQECGGETLDCGASRAFALCDHQVAHIHLESRKDINEVRTLHSSYVIYPLRMHESCYIMYRLCSIATRYSIAVRYVLSKVV
jgi:hypothetical protein